MRREVYERRKKKLISVFIAIVMVSSVMGIAASYYSGNSSLSEYNGHRFSQVNNQFSTKLNGEKVFFNFLPSQVSDIEFSSDFDLIKNIKSLQVAYDLNSTYSQAMAIIQYSMAKSFSDEFNIFVTKGLIEDNDFDLPVLTCDLATKYSPVILFVESNLSEVKFNNNCITVGISSNVEAYRFMDRLRYFLYGVMN